MSGRARKADGVDVVIGVVETHGRAETEALIEGFEVIPRKTVDYRGRVLEDGPRRHPGAATGAGAGR